MPIRLLPQKLNAFDTLNTRRLVLIASILVCAFCAIGQFANVYRFAVTGAIFEMLWLPMIVLLFALPVISFIGWIKSRLSFGSLYFYSLVFCWVGIGIVYYGLRALHC